MSTRLGAALAVALLTAARPPGVAAASTADDAYRASVDQWRHAREEKMRGDDGWLSVAGLFWLEEGPNRFGSARGSAVVLPPDAAPPRTGAFVLRGKRVTVQLEPGVTASVGGQPASGLELRSDAAAAPDVLALGRLRMHVIERGGRFGIRLKDPDNARRRGFTGLAWYPVQDGYRVTARFLPAPGARTIPIPNVLGQVEHMPSPGTAVFTLAGRELRLEPVLEEGSPELFFIFRDLTAGKGTYPAGRFLYADPPANGTIVLDFNKAYSPPCAYTDFATCPLPPPQNRLPVAIEAGEKAPAGRKH